MTEQRRDDRTIDASVDAAWRQAASEQPPAAADAAILAAARAAVRRDAKQRPAAPPSRRWANWQPIAAAAGVIGLSFLLVQMLPRDQLARPRANQDAPQAPAAESTTVTTAPVTAAPANAAPATTAPVTAAPAPSSADARQRPAEPPKAASDEAAVLPGAHEATAGAAPQATLEAAARQSVAAKAESAAAWATRIAALHDAGDLAAAEAELRAFRAVHPDADDYLPEAVKAWAASIDHDSTP